jgi:glyoxylase I family protein
MELVKQELDVGLVTRNAAAARDFYANVMGFEPQPELSLGDLGVQYRYRVGNHFVKLNELRAQPLPHEGGTDKANGMRLLAFILDDLGSVLARCDRAGVRYNRLELPEQSPYEVAFSNDADGNALELVGLKKPAGDALKVRMQIGLTVADVERSKHFYGALLGLRQEPDMKLPRSMNTVGNTRYGFVAGKTTIKFWSKGPDLPTQTGGPGRRTGIRTITGVVPDVDALHETLRTRGVTIKSPPSNFGKARIMFIADPDGNWLEFGSAAKG